MTERAPRDRCRLPAPSWCDGGRALSGVLLTGVQACAAELAKRRLPSASFVPRPDSPLTASSDDSTRTTEPKTPRRPGRNHQHTQHPRLGVLRALISLSSNASLLPGHCSAPLPAPVGSFEKRGVPSRPLPSRRVGAERIILGPGPGRFSPPK